MPSADMTGWVIMVGFHLTRHTPLPGSSMSLMASLMDSAECSSSVTISRHFSMMAAAVSMSDCLGRFGAGCGMPAIGGFGGVGAPAPIGLGGGAIGPGIGGPTGGPGGGKGPPGGGPIEVAPLPPTLGGIGGPPGGNGGPASGGTTPVGGGAPAGPPTPGGGPPGMGGGIIDIIGSRILMKRERTTGSGGLL